MQCINGLAHVFWILKLISKKLVKPTLEFDENVNEMQKVKSKIPLCKTEIKKLALKPLQTQNTFSFSQNYCSMLL